MIEIRVSDSTLLEARNMAEEMGKLHNSITSGQGNVAGFIGELICKNLLNAEHCNTKDYDLILPDGLKVDVKTKRTSVKPKPEYDCSVAKLSLHQQCDAYAFCRVKNDYTLCWFLGLIGHDEYFSKAKFLEKGDIDPSNNYTVKSSCYNLSIKDLQSEEISFRYRDEQCPQHDLALCNTGR